MKTIYYILACTWGVILTLIGFSAAAGLMLLGVKPRRLGPCWHFQFGKSWGGLSLGLVIITDNSPSLHTLKHEFGHTL